MPDNRHDVRPIDLNGMTAYICRRLIATTDFLVVHAHIGSIAVREQQPLINSITNTTFYSRPR